ncbi:SpoIIE family protein phosphatase [Clostridium magnum]|uniref:Phosphoserine phosphatase RsbP n=1 Tax=Clostridium magnum DSM 2767 TaxID=1121326 RepID=A0A162TC90_9CLOT|nr:SpoIIE family protein phosphatase [Clostridium magnum]KZL92460.1 phosphoserine phosphatase RsbP [Clostridium magnum DSM 2767]SHI26584.1 PAS domain S-box-containing protein [Clostridium magnum DSM 2767]
MEYEVIQNIIKEQIEDKFGFEGLLDSTDQSSECSGYGKESCIKLLEGMLKGIPDIIRVFNPDKTILLFNESGYKFYKKNRDEVKGKRCFEILNKKERCEDCDVEKVIETKKMIRTEKYIPEFSKYMEYTCNPVLNKSGQVIFVVEQLRDITERKILANTIKESEERYRKIVNLSPEAIIITVDDKIVLANNQACRLVDEDYSRIIGASVYKYIHNDFIEILKKRIKHMEENRKSKYTFDYKIYRCDNSAIEVEVSSSYLTYKGKPAIQSIIRDITELKKNLNQAAKFQRKCLETTCPCPEKIKMESLYIPARTVSGDFFKMYKVNEDLVVGIVWDVSGKGITAALSVSAFLVLFGEAVLNSHDPQEIIKSLNKKIINHLEERYIAACCFSLDFKNNEAKVVGAGINQYAFQKCKDNPQELIVKGPFLGMFEDSVFDEHTICFESGDRFCFFTDGLDFIFDHEINYLKTHTITEFNLYLKNILNDMLTDGEGIKDDSTLIALEIE